MNIFLALFLYGECISPKQAQLTPCAVVLYDKEGTIQQAGCLLPGHRFRWLHLRAIVLGHPCEVMQGNISILCTHIYQSI